MPPSPRHDPSSGEEEPFTAWPLVICLGVTKVITIVVVLVNVRDQQALMLTIATLLPWLGAAAALLAAPVAWQLRLRRVRRKREALLKAEWRSDEPDVKRGAGSTLRHPAPPVDRR
jgi:hypothetical protein